MTKYEIAQRIAADHNMLSSIFASGGIVFQNSDSVIMMGDTIRDLRTLVQRIQAEADSEAKTESSEA